MSSYMRGVSAGLKASNIRIVDAAAPPTQPVKPRLFLNLALALLVGMGLRVGTAFLQEHLDNTLKTPDDIERFPRFPALALIPSCASLNPGRKGIHGLSERRSSSTSGNGKLAPLVKKLEEDWIRIDGNNGTTHSALSEAFRSLRT